MPETTHGGRPEFVSSIFSYFIFFFCSFLPFVFYFLLLERGRRGGLSSFKVNTEQIVCSTSPKQNFCYELTAGNQSQQMHRSIRSNQVRNDNEFGQVRLTEFEKLLQTKLIYLIIRSVEFLRVILHFSYSNRLKKKLLDILRTDKVVVDHSNHMIWDKQLQRYFQVIFCSFANENGLLLLPW